jgi:two-component system, sensor histidine kinase and response regulator
VDSMAKPRMLVVDDDPRSRKLLAGFLLAEGYEVHTAPDGLTALSMVRSDPPDVVLLDVMMPEMTGYDVCKILKSEDETRACQVMLVTALDSTPDQITGLDTGADDYLPKPVRRDEFLAKVRALVRARRLIEDLEQARNELSRRNAELQLKKTLAQTLVHDLKSPLSAILGNLDLLKHRGDPELHYLIDRSKLGAKRMLKMILNLLDVEGLEEGRMKPSLERVDLADLLEATVDEARVTAEQREIRIELHADGPVWAEADPALTRRVADNLISNALTYSPKGSRVEVRVGYCDSGVELAVSDEGPGVPEPMREKIFEKYEQVDARDAGVSINRGLGLTFCRLAVEAQGGTIWIDRAPGGGAWFRTVLASAQLETETIHDAIERPA